MVTRALHTRRRKRHHAIGLLMAGVTALGLLAYLSVSRAGAADVTPKDTGVKVVQGVTYLTDECPGEGMQTQLADAYLPSPPLERAAPAVILVHGGGFVSGVRDSAWFVKTGTYLASKGWAVFSIDYCMPPRGTAGFPVEVQNVQAATEFLAENASTYRVDPDRIAVWGTSAGATLATHTAALTGKEQGEVSVVAAVGWSGAYDFTDFTGASPGNIRTSLNYLGCDPRRTRACMATAVDASPVSHVASTTPPMLLANSVDEKIPLNQLKVMNAALVEADVETTTLLMPAGKHGLAYSSHAFCPTVAFLETYLSPIPGTCAAP